MIKFEVKNRYSDEVMFTANIDCHEYTPNTTKIGLAVKWATKNIKCLREADLRMANFKRMDLSWADFTDADLTRANLWDANLTEADLTEANLNGAYLIEADLAGANLTGAYLIEAKLTEANLNGAYLIEADLAGADLTRANLIEANLIEANLTRANLTRANLWEANLTQANLTGADLTGANLWDANLTEANLTGAIFREKDLRIFKHDFWGVLLYYQNETPNLIQYIKDGKIDGSVYSGECSCLMGSIANIANKPIEDPQFMMKNPKSPIERWFTMIKKGHNPENSFASIMALQWAKEFMELNNRIDNETK